MRRHELARLLVEVLARQHRRIRELVDEVIGAQRASGQAATVDRLLGYLSLHESAEQIAVHPVGMIEVGELTAVPARIREEQEVAALISRLEECPPASVDFMIYFGLLDEALSAHMSAEERIEAPAIAAGLGDDRLRHMVAALDLVDEWAGADPSGAPVLGGHPAAGRQSAPRYDERVRSALRAFEHATSRG